MLAYDPAGHRLYVAAESGDLTILDNRDRHLTVTGRAHLADGAHVVAVNPATHDSYYLIMRQPRPVARAAFRVQEGSFCPVDSVACVI